MAVEQRRHPVLIQVMAAAAEAEHRITEGPQVPDTVIMARQTDRPELSDWADRLSAETAEQAGTEAVRAVPVLTE